MLFFFFTPLAPTQIYTLSLHDALPISQCMQADRYPDVSVERTTKAECQFRQGNLAGYCLRLAPPPASTEQASSRSEEHTSELQSRRDLVCRLLLEKKK